MNGAYKRPELEYDSGPALLSQPWFTHWENRDANIALSTSKSSCDDQIITGDADVPRKL